MTTTTAGNLRVGNYEFDKFIDIGGTSIVFRGVHWRLRESHNAHQYVALKLMWDLDVARDEMARLIESDTVTEVCSLLDYFEVNYSEVAEVVEPFKILLSDHDEPPNFEADHKFAVVVLQFMAGVPLVITEPFEPGLTEPAETLSWFITHDERQWRQSLRWKLNRQERLRIIQQMVAAIKDSHQHDPPIVHGDLNPANVLYEKATGRVRLIDYGILGRGGVEGWNSPWHYALGRGEITDLPPEADVFMMSHWIRRLLGNVHPAYNRLADQISKRSDDVTDAVKLQDQLTDIEVGIRSKRTGKLLTFVILLVCVIWLGVLWQASDNRNRLSTEKTIQRYVALADESDDGFRQAQSKLLDFLHEPENQRYYTQIVAGLAQVNLDKGSNQLTHLNRINFSEPNVVVRTSKERVILFDQYPFFEGSFINENEYILRFDWRGMDVFDGERERRIEFPQHDMPIDQTAESYALIWPSRIGTLLAGLTSYNRTFFFNLSSDTSTLVGIYYIDDVDTLLRQITTTVSLTWFSHEPLTLRDLPRSHYVHWVFHKNMEIEANRVDQFIRVLVKDQLGYGLELVPAALGKYQIADVINNPIAWDSYLRNVLHGYGFDFELVEEGRRSWVQIYQKEGGG